MSYRPNVLLLGIGLYLAMLAVRSTQAQEASEEPQSIAQLDATLEAMRKQEGELFAQLRAARADLSELDRAWQQARREREDLNQKLKALAKDLEQQHSDQATAAEAEAVAKAVLKELESDEAAVQEKLAESRTQHDEARSALTKVNESIAAAEREVKELQSQRPMLDQREAETRDARGLALQSVDDLADQMRRLIDARVSHQHRLQSQLKATGNWVSFADQIAPIFQQRCVACHTTSNAQGQYSMATYQAVVSDAASGPVVQPGDGDASPLVHYIEDGWMPHESEPLLESEVEQIRQWINTGARLDAGLDPQAKLIRIMPKRSHPAPPDTYRVALPVTAVAISDDGTLVASSGYHEVLLWDRQSGELLRRLTNLPQRINGLDFHPDGERIAVAAGTPGRIGEAKVFRWREGTEVGRSVLWEDSALSVAWSPDGMQLAAGGADGSIAVMARQIETSVVTAAAVATSPVRWFEGHSDWVLGLDWSLEGTLLLSASRDKTAKVFEVVSGRLVQTFSGHASPVHDVVALADGRHAATVADDHRIRKWRLDNGKQSHAGDVLERTSSFIERSRDASVLAFSDRARIGAYQFADLKKKQDFDLNADWATVGAVAVDASWIVIGDESGKIHVVSMKAEADPATWVGSPLSDSSGTSP